MQHTGCNIEIILQCAGCNTEIILQCAALCRWAFCLSRVWDIISNISNSPKTEGDTPGKSKFGYPYRRNQRGFISRDHVLHLAKLTHVGISVSPRDAVLTFCACSQKNDDVKRIRYAMWTPFIQAMYIPIKTMYIPVKQRTFHLNNDYCWTTQDVIKNFN